MTKAVQDVVGIDCGWKYSDSWCADTLCFTSLGKGFESHTNLKCNAVKISNLCFTRLNWAITSSKQSKGKVDQRTVTRWLKEFCSSYKKLENQARSSGRKMEDSEDVLQAVQENTTKSTQRRISAWSVKWQVRLISSEINVLWSTLPSPFTNVFSYFCTVMTQLKE